MALRDPAPAPCADEWQLSCAEVNQRGAALLRAGTWADCTLLVGAERAPLRAHRLLLAMASPVFAAMFYGAMQEDTVAIPDLQPDTFNVLLGYIYSDEVSISSFDLCCDLYYAAQKYMLQHLAKVCSTYMCCNLLPHEACRAYEIAHLFDDKKLMAEAMQIISSKTKDVFGSEGFVEAELNTVVHIFSSEPLDIDSELELFNAAERYARAQHNSNNEEKPRTFVNQLHSAGPSSKTDLTIRTALEKVRFLTLTSEQFAEGPAQSTLLTKEETFAILLNISSKNISTPMPSGFSTSRKNRSKFGQVAKVPYGVAGQTANNDQNIKPPLIQQWEARFSVNTTYNELSYKLQSKEYGMPNHPTLKWRIVLKPTSDRKYLGFFLLPSSLLTSYYVEAELRVIPPLSVLCRQQTRKFKHVFHSGNETDWGFPQFMSLPIMASYAPYSNDRYGKNLVRVTFEAHIVVEIANSDYLRYPASADSACSSSGLCTGFVDIYN